MTAVAEVEADCDHKVVFFLLNVAADVDFDLILVAFFMDVDSKSLLTQVAHVFGKSLSASLRMFAIIPICRSTILK